MQCNKIWPKSRPARHKFCGKECYQSFQRTILGRDKHTYHHGMSKTPFYTKWSSMTQRCSDQKCERYPIYGGRGIRVCKDWEKFEYFYRDMYESYCLHLKVHGRINTTLDRIDPNGNYEIENCRWATRSQQASNRRGRNGRPKTFLSYKGKRQGIDEWANELGIKYSTLYMRITTYGWSVEKALSKK